MGETLYEQVDLAIHRILQQLQLPQTQIVYVFLVTINVRI